jgi:hypothetical protein
VTNLSKKIIFLLHRIMTEDTNDTDRALSLRAASAGREKLAEITAIYAEIKHELMGDRFWRYHRCISPSIQEFIEALSFIHYLEHGILVTLEDVQHILSDQHGVPVSMHTIVNTGHGTNKFRSFLFYRWTTIFWVCRISRES